MGIGHIQKVTSKRTQGVFQFSGAKNPLSYGGDLRKSRKGRFFRPLSSQEPIHVVFKIQKSRLKHRSLRSPQSFSLLKKILKRYAQMFFIKVEQCSIQNDHVHLLIRTTRRSFFHSFFRVLAGQIAQQFEKEGLLSVSRNFHATDTPKRLKKVKKPGLSLWKHRPFSRVVRGFKAYKIIRNYIQLNEKEVLGQIKYQKLRLKGLSSGDWQILWS